MTRQNMLKHIFIHLPSTHYKAHYEKINNDLPFKRHSHINFKNFVEKQDMRSGLFIIFLLYLTFINA